MKTDQLLRLFPQEELRQVLTSGKEEVSKDDFARRLLKSPQREKMLKLYFKAIDEKSKALDPAAKRSSTSKMQQNKYDREILVRIAAKFRKTYEKSDKTKLSTKVRETSEKICALFKGEVEAKLKQEPSYVFIDGVKVKEEKIIPKGFKFETFPTGACKISELREKLADTKLLKNEHNAIKKASSSFAHHHLKARPKGLQKLNATVARFGNKQNYFMLGCPSSLERAQEFINTILEKRIGFMVSLNETGEGKRPAFWKKDVLEKLKLKDGWTITQDKNKTRILGAGYDEATQKTLKIVERCLVAKKDGKEKKLLHLHYQGWVDALPSPNERLMNVLLDRIDELQHKTIPFSTNCQHGVGRTGEITVTNYCRRHIDKQREKGKRLDQITINIPKIIYDFRKHRSGIVGRSDQYIQVNSLVASYYEKLKQEDKPLAK
jgi:protein tyrosine phosphatase